MNEMDFAGGGEATKKGLQVAYIPVAAVFPRKRKEK